MDRLHVTKSPREVAESPDDTSAADVASISRRVIADIENGATFVVVTGSPDAGRTRLCELVVKPAGSRSFPLVIDTPPPDFDALVIDVLQRFGLGHPGRSNRVSHDDLVVLMRRFLRSVSLLHGQVLLVFDHADRLTPHVIEQLHALTTFQPEGQAVLQIVLVGKPPLLETLCAHTLRDVEPTMSRRYHLVEPEPPPTRSIRRTAPSFVSRWWVAVATTPALVIVVYTGSWAIRQDVVFSEKPSTSLPKPASSGYVSPAIAAPASDNRPAADTSVKTDPVVPGGTASLQPAGRVQKPETLEEIVGRAAALAAAPDVKALVKLREQVANRLSHSTVDAEREGIASTLQSLERALEEARRLQLEIDGRKLTGRGGRRAATDVPPSQ